MYLVCEEIINQDVFNCLIGKADNITEIWSLLFSLGELRKDANSQEIALMHNSIMIYKVSCNNNDAKQLESLLNGKSSNSTWQPSCDMWGNWLYLGFDTDEPKGNNYFTMDESILINRVIHKSILVFGDGC